MMTKEDYADNSEALDAGDVAGAESQMDALDEKVVVEQGMTFKINRDPINGQ